MSDNIGISLAGIIDIIAEYGLEIRKAGNNIEWKFQGETDEFWRLLMDATELNSQIIEMQRGETSLQWRIVGSDEWLDLISYDDIAYIGSQPIRTKFNNRLTISGRLLQDNESPPEPIDYMSGQPLCWRDGEYYNTNYLPMSPINTKNTFVVNSNELKLWPIKIMNSTSIVDLGFSVVTEAADSSIKIVIYNGSELLGKPTTKLFESESFDCSTAGNKLNAIPFWIEAGYYFVGYQKTGEGTPTLRSIADTSYNIISSFSTLELAGDDASNIDLTKSCYQYDEIVDDLSEVDYEISGSDRVIFATMRANSEAEVYFLTSGSVGVSTRDGIWCEYEQCFYLVANSAIYKSFDLVNFEELTYEVENYDSPFSSICEVSGGRIVIVDYKNLWLKEYGSNHFVKTTLECEKGNYGTDNVVNLHGHQLDQNVYATFVYNIGQSVSLNVFNMNLMVRSFVGTIGSSLACLPYARGVRCSTGEWVFVGNSYDNFKAYRWTGAALVHLMTVSGGRDYRGVCKNKETDDVYILYRDSGGITYCRHSSDAGVTWSDGFLINSTAKAHNCLSMDEKFKVYSRGDMQIADDAIIWRNNDFDAYQVTVDYNIDVILLRMMHCVWNGDDQTFATFLNNGTIQIFKYINKE